MFHGQDIFYFQAQTGVVRNTRPRAPSNYHWYWLPTHHRFMVDAAVELATVGSGGLEYPEGAGPCSRCPSAHLFIQTLDGADMSGLEHLPDYALIP